MSFRAPPRVDLFFNCFLFFKIAGHVKRVMLPRQYGGISQQATTHRNVTLHIPNG
jgi:hypothetical protein